MLLNVVAPSFLRVKPIRHGSYNYKYASTVMLLTQSPFNTSASTFNQWSRNSLRKLRKANLEALAKERKLPSKGTKEELISRLLGWQEAPPKLSTQSTLTDPVKNVAGGSASKTPSVTSIADDITFKTKEAGSSKTEVENPEEPPVISTSNSVNAVTGDRTEQLEKHPEQKSHISKTSFVKMMADYVDEQLPPMQNSNVDINYEESQADETLVPENWIKAFEMKVHNRGHKVNGNKATMTFKRRSATQDQRPSSSNLKQVSPTIIDDEISEMGADLEAEFDRQWVNAFDRKVAQRGSRRILELNASATEKENNDNLDSSLSSINISDVTAEGLLESSRTKPTDWQTLEKDASNIIRNLWATPISELSVSQLVASTQESQPNNEKESSQKSHGGGDDESHHHGESTGNHTVSAALGATTLIWLIGGEDGISRAYAKLKSSKSDDPSSA
ncbi:hypothetical protein K450DRAFT_224633 [Umbelopsis ramanniana AG]|uniref:SAP domain-containing protein n=1 Tax=Umbelopsis ramanniana AG TaxID=1314678 RepID=A0AAD5HIE4_UMBRA|nr:uncharacterized protein K450DRAFT_224633 [Umbelopsis ramanniana AG]KAI8583188.1 hypothetical protein K450DRAFT_224633 [Umbelopsis ramanniana AG]